MVELGTVVIYLGICIQMLCKTLGLGTKKAEKRTFQNVGVERKSTICKRSFRKSD